MSLLARLSPRTRSLGQAAGLLLLGGLLVFMGLDTVRLVCSRAAGTCTQTWRLRSSTTTSSLAEVRDVRYYRHKERGGPRGVVVLVDGTGDERTVFRGPVADAESFQRQLRALLAGEQELLRHEDEPSLPLLSFGALAIGWGIYTLFSRKGTGGTTATRARGAGRPFASRQVRIFMGVVVVAFIAARVFDLIAMKTMGTLRLVCHQRCELQGMSCMPGASSALTLPEGQHIIQVWAPDLPGGYETHTVTLVAGQETRFECKAPAPSRPAP